MKIKGLMLVLLVILYFIVSLVISIFKSDRIIFLGYHTKVSVDNNTIKVYSKNEVINNMEVNVLFNGEYKEGYLYTNINDINNINEYYVVSNNKKLEAGNSLIASPKNIDIDAKDLISSKVTDEEKKSINNYLNNDVENISINIIKKYNFDFNNDGTFENMYEVHADLDEDRYYSFILLKSGNSYQTIDKSILVFKYIYI